MKLNVNGQAVEVTSDPETPLAYVLRNELKLKGTKIGCGLEQCGACTVLADGEAVQSCATPAAVFEGRAITTVEGVESPEAMAVREAWRDLDVVQCGYCQSGQMMSATALLERNPKPSDADIDTAMQGNLCRCATYHRIRAAIHRAAETLEA